jgi:hypothetical protein
MDKVQYFITLAAWVGSIFFSFKTILLIVFDYKYNQTTYGKLEKLLDEMKGFEKTFKLKYNPAAAVVSIIWLIVYYFV